MDSECVECNCWEFKKCGREPDGNKAKELGVCIASTYDSFDGVNDGDNAGRCCWAVAGTLCGGIVQGIAADKIASCKDCDFYQQVQIEEEKKEEED